MVSITKSIEINCMNQKRSTFSFPVDKRADGDDKGSQSMEQPINGDNDRLSDLLDLNSEPAVEDLMRQIMSQAKLWEAIQEANREIVIQKDVRSENTKEHFPLAFSAQWMGPKKKL